MELFEEKRTKVIENSSFYHTLQDGRNVHRRLLSDLYKKWEGNQFLDHEKLISRACLSRARLLKCSRFFFIGGTWFVGPAFLAKTVESGDKNRGDFHCMEMSLVMRMLFIFGDDRKGACKFGNEVIFLEWRLLIFV